MMRRLIAITFAAMTAAIMQAADTFIDFNGGTLHLNKGSEVSIYVAPGAPKGIRAAAENLCRDITAVCGARASFTPKASKARIVIATTPNGKWEHYTINADARQLTITGSDRRGTIYGIYELSRQIGVSPWYWWADVPTPQHKDIYARQGEYSDGEPAVKYRGIFINDEDWGLLPWAAGNFEKELGDIGPKTYAKVCELILRLKGNMLAPAMHSCTGAFYSHPESKTVADSLGVIITTSHCEPLLLNNAAKTEWDKARDGEWNYATNRAAIKQKWEDRLAEAAHLDNIYTMAMRGVHDEGLRGDLPMEQRVALLQEVIRDQREMLARHTGKAIEDIPQIFVPYKETMDIYESGLRLPDDITIVWADDNYGYMKHISTPEEQRRKGGTGIYYHLSYLGTPHDYLWLNTTPPQLMYQELSKAYNAGADRYWLLNVGDIKPMELGIATFFDLAWNAPQWDAQSILRHQPQYLARIFGQQHLAAIARILTMHYQLAWPRKPEYMGGEWEWDTPERCRIQDTQFSFNDGTAQRRLQEYDQISQAAEDIMISLPASLQPAFYQLVAYPVQAAAQMNRKYLYAQLNRHAAAHRSKAAANWAAQQSQAAHDSINTLTQRYNALSNGKWQGIMAVPPGYTALYHAAPKLATFPLINLQAPTAKTPDCTILQGLGTDGHALKLGDPNTPDSRPAVTYTLPTLSADTVSIRITFIPTFPINKDKTNELTITIDNNPPHTLHHHPQEWSAQWKQQVITNQYTHTIHTPLQPSAAPHTITITTSEPGLIIQSIEVE